MTRSAAWHLRGVGGLLFFLASAHAILADTNVWTRPGPQGPSVNAPTIDPTTPIALHAGTDGAGVFSIEQALAAPTPSPPPSAPSVCVGDCGGTGSVAINNIIMLVNIALGTAEPSACPHGVPGGADVNVAVIIQAVNSALNGCSATTPTPTSTPQAGAACTGRPDGTACDAGTDSSHTLTCSGGTCGECAADTSAPRFVDNGDGTITDRLTCLVWEKKDDAGGLHDKDNTYSWCLNANGDFNCDNPGGPSDGSAFAVFLAGLNSTAFAGHQDWRLPKEDGRNGSGPNELESILAAPPPCSVHNPCVDAVFNTNCRILSAQHSNPGCTVDGAGGTQECSCTQPLSATTYWSASTTNGDPGFAWDVGFGVDGFVLHNSKTTRNFVRAVRGGL